MDVHDQRRVTARLAHLLRFKRLRVEAKGPQLDEVRALRKAQFNESKPRHWQARGDRAWEKLQERPPAHLHDPNGWSWGSHCCKLNSAWAPLR